MVRRVLIAAAAAVLTAAPALIAQGDPLGSLRGEYVLHYNAGHPDAVAALFTADAVLMTSEGVTRGRDAIREGLAAELAEGSPKLGVTMEEAKMSGDWAFERGEYTVSITPAEGGPQAVGGSYVVIARKDGGAWKIAWGISNSRQGGM